MTPRIPLNPDDLRDEFLRLLTEDSATHDRRRSDYNQALFDKEQGWAIWSSTDLDMVMDKFDRAVRRVAKESIR